MPFHELKRRVLALLIVAGVCIVSLSPRVEPDRDADADWSLSHVVEQTDNSSATATKTETVYINLSANGIVNKVNVTDHLHTEYPQVRVEDVSNLRDIQDVKTFLEPVYGVDRIYWDMESTDLFYQGVSEDSPPMDFTIQYTLDGQTIFPEQLIGQSGKVSIEITAHNQLMRDADGYTIYCPMLLVGGMILPEEHFSNVTVSSGAVLGDGAQQIVMLAGIPGMEESLGISSLGLPILNKEFGGGSFTVTADVTDFQLGNMMFGVVPFSSIDALCSGDLARGLDGVKGVFSDIETVLNAFNSMGAQELIQMLYGDMDQIEALMAALGDAALLYRDNRALIETLSGYMTEENLQLLDKLLADMQQIDMVRLEALLDCTLFQQLVDLLSLIDQEIRDVVTVAEDAVAIMPVMDAMKAELEQPEQAASMERLPETITQLRGLIQTLGENQNVLDDLSALQSTRVTENLRTVMGVAQKYAGLQSLNAAQQQNLSYRMQAWLAFGEEYDIFTQRTNAMDSSVTFVYKVASIGA